LNNDIIHIYIIIFRGDIYGNSTEGTKYEIYIYRDLKEKFYLYQKSGVKEYWIVYPEEKTIVVYSLNQNGKYGRTDVYSEEDIIKVGIFESLELNLIDIFSE
jgi:Uma2 family endonuclease